MIGRRRRRPAASSSYDSSLHVIEEPLSCRDLFILSSRVVVFLQDADADVGSLRQLLFRPVAVQVVGDRGSPQWMWTE